MTLRKRKPKRDSGTRSKVSKKPLRDPEHLARVRTKRCWSCFAAQGTEAHHIRECYPRTMGRRIGDDKTIPLCSPCHIALHRRSRTFWQGSKDSVVSYAAALYVESLSLRGEANPNGGTGR